VFVEKNFFSLFAQAYIDISPHTAPMCAVEIEHSSEEPECLHRRMMIGRLNPSSVALRP